MTGYEAKITYSSKELTAREKIKLKDLTNAVQLDEATQNAEFEGAGNLVITPDYYAEVSVHNEKSDSKDYVKLTRWLTPVKRATTLRYTAWKARTTRARASLPAPSSNTNSVTICNLLN